VTRSLTLRWCRTNDTRGIGNHAVDGTVFAVRLRTRDTNLPFGSGSLDRQSQTFLGLRKSTALSDDEKEDMLRTFRTRPHDAFAYAITDAVNTLLVWEAMRKKHQRVYRSFGFPKESIPEMAATAGSRVAKFLTTMALSTAAAGSIELANTTALEWLMKQGGAERFSSDTRVSRFGEQTAKTHGGLNFSRSGACLWHEADGQLRDVDLSGCYNTIIGGMQMYLGRPLVFEPGNSRMKLCEAVEFLSRESDPDAWCVRVTGPIDGIHNALIPSTLGALTPEGYVRSRRRKSKRTKLGGSKLFSKVIESGIVTLSTWLMIQALPKPARECYERLNIDSIVFYPRRLVAASGPAYDELVASMRSDRLPWTAKLDLDGLRIHEVIEIDESYVSLRFPIGDYARKFGSFRQEARDKFGKSSGMDLAWKLMANSMWGVTASRHFAINSVVAANIVTAQARAVAFSLIAALNGIQVITDGCTYRRDQIPTCTLKECLRLQPDYLIRRADMNSKIPFLDPAEIPEDGPLFTEWCFRHVKRFFGISGPEYDDLFGPHKLEHKKSEKTDGTAFDALACDGSGNYVKCERNADGTLDIIDAATRGYRKSSKDTLAKWMVKAYSDDAIIALPPITEDEVLLKLKEAKQKVRGAFAEGINEVVCPLGFEFTRVRNYKVFKTSAFVFQTPAQYNAFVKQYGKFIDRTGCGLELLALRRRYKGRRNGSLGQIGQQTCDLIRAGCRDFTKALNLNRALGNLQMISEERRTELDRRRDQAKTKLFAAMDTSGMPNSHLLTGLVLTPASYPWR
jgi:hypothetical protein